MYVRNITVTVDTCMIPLSVICPCFRRSLLPLKLEDMLFLACVGQNYTQNSYLAA